MFIFKQTIITMIKKYEFEYDNSASVVFEVDLEKFTPEMANATLTFFSWTYDDEADPIDAVIKKYALEAIIIATSENLNTYGVLCAFDDNEGFCPINGTRGIKLIRCIGYEFLEDNLDVKITENPKPLVTVSH